MYSLALVLTANLGFTQSKDAIQWSKPFQTSRSFIVNKGQYRDDFPLFGTERAAFVSEQGSARYFFTKKGLSIHYTVFDRKIKKLKTHEEREKSRRQYKTVMDWKEHEHQMHTRTFFRDRLELEWVNANPTVQMIPQGLTPDYHNYLFHGSNGQYQSISFVEGYESILYKNLYPNIDVEYVVPEQGGIKYNIILHPGANPADLQIRYSGTPTLQPDLSIQYETRFGPMKDHAPISFYQDDKKNQIFSRFQLNGNIVSFELGTYDKNRTVVIDPWIQNPSFPTNWDCVWECEKDGAGNVYIIGGVMPMQLLKYNNSGVLQWTFNTPYDTSYGWLGTFATDNAGNSYVTNGSVAEIIKVNTNG
ncbi:MAG: hypothetical protein NZ108_05100, partial [Bacteroidia bacterium]|nr:hypothetical protein [Bacteroidia bacterium]